MVKIRYFLVDLKINLIYCPNNKSEIYFAVSIGSNILFFFLLLFWIKKINTFLVKMP